MKGPDSARYQTDMRILVTKLTPHPMDFAMRILFYIGNRWSGSVLVDTLARIVRADDPHVPNSCRFLSWFLSWFYPHSSPHFVSSMSILGHTTGTHCCASAWLVGSFSGPALAPHMSRLQNPHSWQWRTIVVNRQPFTLQCHKHSNKKSKQKMEVLTGTSLGSFYSC